MESLRKKYLRLLGSIDTSKKRSLFHQISWENRLVIIRGQRGVGKTTLLLQHIREMDRDPDETLYVSLDDIYFSGHTLSELAEEFVVEGGKYLFLDEVHRYPGWSREIKNIYDFYPSLNLVVTGSSALSFYISGADLGRRAAIYNLPEMSYREFLYFSQDIEFDSLTLEDLLKHHERIAMEVNRRIRSVKLFREYLRYGAYPFILEGKEKYQEKVEWLINTVIDNDIPALENITYESRIKMRKLLLMMATSSPWQVNLSELSRKLETSRDVLTKFLNLLAQAGIIRLLTTSGVGYTILRKPDKIYFSNSNMLFSIYEEGDIGTARETFFLDQLSAIHQVAYPKNGDFLVDGKYLFEIGGKNKTFRQIHDHPRAYLAVDDIEYGHKNRIPLWLFGFLY